MPPLIMQSTCIYSNNTDTRMVYCYCLYYVGKNINRTTGILSWNDLTVLVSGSLGITIMKAMIVITTIIIKIYTYNAHNNNPI